MAHKGGAGLGEPGDTQQPGEHGIAILDHNGSVLAPLLVAPVNDADTRLGPEGVKGLKRGATRTGVGLNGSYLNLDGGFDSQHPRQAIFHAGLIPHIKETPRNRPWPKRGRKRLFTHTLQARRDRVERMLTWAEQCKRLWRHFDHRQRRPSGMTLMAYTRSNLRRWCAT
jgi:transposase